MSAPNWTVVRLRDGQVQVSYEMATDEYNAFALVAQAFPDDELVAAIPGDNPVYTPSDDNDFTCYGIDYPTE